ncbi:MAG: hypothetical protein ABIE94_04615 [archaeon]
MRRAEIIATASICSLVIFISAEQALAPPGAMSIYGRVLPVEVVVGDTLGIYHGPQCLATTIIINQPEYDPRTFTETVTGASNGDTLTFKMESGELVGEPLQNENGDVIYEGGANIETTLSRSSTSVPEFETEPTTWGGIKVKYLDREE